MQSIEERLKVGYEPKTFFGGVLTLLGISYIVFEVIVHSEVRIFSSNYNFNKVYHPAEDMANFDVSLGKFN